MSLQEIQNAASRSMADEKIPTTDGLCRDAVILILALASTADISPPKATCSPLVWPGSTTNPNETCIHYAFQAESQEGILIINPVSAPGFPEYNQIDGYPPGLLGHMIKTDNVV